MTTQTPAPPAFPLQHQSQQPGVESQMNPRPVFEDRAYKAAGKLTGKTAVVTGGDSGIGRAVAVTYAKEGADIVIAYLNEHEDAEETKRQVEEEGRRCLKLAGDLGTEAFCKQVIEETIKAFGKLDIVVNNAAEQHPQTKLEDISAEQLERTFRTNLFSFFYLTKAALPHLKQGSAVINTASITAYEGSEDLLDYSATKGAIVTFTRSLSQQLVGRGIRVNGVAPGPIWTPLIPSTFDEKKVSKFGTDVPMKRAGQPEELAPSYVFLACDDSSYMTGQMLHVNGGVIVGS
ncbi:SDR family oxidoreductase [Paenibacillus filicis]|uniref:SDR family oxidoreductase n=1 Tax=Paenibacillus gyeongsangnamensis TaxID=3388067 RepID=A0ABT4Q891_9BACL|nr:SDR family oxidoreductase [Paenibacillus filicis]MCZ8513099.1 SDR family oxidoreductase [Paenibacillus filicis]